MTLQEELNELTEKAADRIIELETKIASLESQLMEKDKEIERLKLEFDCEWSTREKLDADNQILLSKINDLRAEIERLKDTVKDRDYERFHRDAYFEELREALRESISYIEGRNHGIEGVSLLDRCRKLIGD